MTMNLRIGSFVLFCLFLSAQAQAQVCFPVKVKHKWGLMNADGEMFLAPFYDAIGEFDKSGLKKKKITAFIFVYWKFMI